MITAAGYGHNLLTLGQHGRPVSSGGTPAPDLVEHAERAIGALHAALRPGGILVLGINEEWAQTPDLAQVRALERFRPIAPPPFGASRHVVRTPLESTHTFLFFARA